MPCRPCCSVMRRSCAWWVSRPNRCARGCVNGARPNGRGRGPTAGGAAQRQGPRTTGPSCPDTLAEHIVPLNVRDLEALFNGVIRALAQTGVFATKVTGIVDATDLETTAQYAGCGQVTRKRKVTDKRGKVHEIEVTVYGWKLIVLIEARTKIPWRQRWSRSRSTKRFPCGP